MTEQKNGFVEVWRGIGVVTVVWYHYTDRIPYQIMGASGPPSLPSQVGKLGVFAFFVISGYLIAASLMSSRDFAGFYAKRLSRIWPLFFVASLTVFGFVQVLPAPVVRSGPDPFNESSVTWLDLIGSIFFLNDFGFHWVDGAYWSILVEIKFYLYIALITIVRKEAFDKWFGAFAVVIAGGQLILEVFAPYFAIGFRQILNGIFVAQYLPFFAIGVMIYKKNIGSLLTICIIISTTRAIIVVGKNPNFDLISFGQFFAALSMLLSADMLILNSGLLKFFGKYSYSFYLFHQMIGLTIIKLAVHFIQYDFAIVLAFATTLLLAVIMSELFEWRFRKRVERGLYTIFSALRLNRLRIHPE